MIRWRASHLGTPTARKFAGGCPAASYFLLLLQKKVAKEKATQHAAPTIKLSAYSVLLETAGGCGTRGSNTFCVCVFCCARRANSPRRHPPLLLLCSTARHGNSVAVRRPTYEWLFPCRRPGGECSLFGSLPRSKMRTANTSTREPLQSFSRQRPHQCLFSPCTRLNDPAIPRLQFPCASRPESNPSTALHRAPINPACNKTRQPKTVDSLT